MTQNLNKGPVSSLLDRGVALALMMRAAQLAGGLVVLLVVAKYFTPKLQGYYYTFSALISLQTYLELGFGIVLVQFASHEWAHLGFDARRRVTGDSDAQSRLGSLGRLSFPFYLGLGGALMIILGSAGAVLFGSSASASDVDWSTPWIAVSVLTGMNLWLLPAWALLEGCNQVSEVYFYRLTETILTNGVLLTAIVGGAELWAVALSAMVKFAYGTTYLLLRHRNFLAHFKSRPSGPSIRWGTDILPMQWRMSLTWLSGSLLFTVFTPVAFRYQGPVVAGQVGMTLNMTSALSIVSFVWVSTTVPTLGMLIARRDYRRLDRLFFRKAALSFGMAVIGCAAIVGLAYWLQATGNPLSTRMLPIRPLTVFLAATLCLVASSPFGAYLRAHKREPLVTISVVSSVAAGFSIWWFGSLFGPIGMATAYLVVMAGSLVAVLAIWMRCRAEWHADVPTPPRHQPVVDLAGISR